MSQVLATDTWADNGAMIADVARLGYLDGRVLDCTYGFGTFWSEWRPKNLVGCDIVPDRSPIGYPVDFCHMPFPDQMFDSVVFDPPYKLNGTPDPDLDERYGIHIPTRWQDRMDLIGDGTIEAARVSNRYLLVKCQDQVCSGKVRWQTDLVTAIARDENFRKVDRFDFLSYRPQPANRSQVHARRNSSQLLVFERNT